MPMLFVPFLSSHLLSDTDLLYKLILIKIIIFAIRRFSQYLHIDEGPWGESAPLLCAKEKRPPGNNNKQTPALMLTINYFNIKAVWLDWLLSIFYYSTVCETFMCMQRNFVVTKSKKTSIQSRNCTAAVANSNNNNIISQNVMRTLMRSDVHCIGVDCFRHTKATRTLSTRQWLDYWFSNKKIQFIKVY